ncbi:MAG: TldE/PmbA family protein [Burkholderiales bacterium]|nr:TldE/PmbA family protein [Burkholderiales bacterium]
MKAAFLELADRLCAELGADEALLLELAAERSDFVRFNHARVRQAGSVEQRFLSVRLVRARRQATAGITLAGNGGDLAHARATLARLRDAVALLPEDPWLLVNEQPESTDAAHRGRLAPGEDVVRQVVGAARGRDLVGIYAGGTIYRGLASSYGQRNWHEVDCFNLDWSLYLRGDKAVKTGYAGFDWDAAALEAKVEGAAAELALLALPPRTIAPGEYRAYLAPRALEELMGLLCWGGFSARARATRQCPLMRMEHGETLSPKVTLIENTADGVGPRFQHDGFVKPPQVTLVAEGRLGEPLVSPRSAREYDLPTNAAGAHESPEALDMSPGDLAPGEALRALDTGLAIGNLWYLNYSDRAAGRITGMTRFATFWVESGRIVAPVEPMRFDDSVYRMLGRNLVDLTERRELLLDAGTYGERSTGSMRLPGALLGALRLTL